MRGQAVHEERAAAGGGHQRLVHLEGHEHLAPRGGLALLAHRRPHVRVDGVGARDRIVRIVRHVQRAAGAHDLGRGVPDRNRQLEARRRGNREPAAEHGDGIGERRRDVVAVTHERDCAIAQAAPSLDHRQDVGERLARMLLVAQRVDDAQPGRGGREQLDAALRERPNHRGEDPSLEVAGDVFDRFASAERDVGRRLDHVAPELTHRDREGRAGPERRLLEEQRDVAAGQRRRVLAARAARRLHRRREVEARLEIRWRHVADREELRQVSVHANAQSPGRRGVQAHVRYSALMRTYSALRSHVHMRLLPAPPVPRSTRSMTSVRCRCSDASPARSSYGWPSANSSTPPIDTRAPSKRKSTPARPATATRRPQFGSAPWTAVFTSGELAIARAAVLASASDRAPVTSTVTSFVAPSPPRTIPSASGSHTCRSASTSTGRSRSSTRTPDAPEARANTQSFVEHSPSTEMALNVASVTVISARCSTAGVTCASVVTTASIVAINGSIIPEPLAMPPTRKRPDAVVTSTDVSFGNGSVVMIARAAADPPSAESAPAAASIPATTRSGSRRTPITPVEATRISAGSQWSRVASDEAIVCAVVSPSAPVQAFAQPLLMTTARARPAETCRFDRETSTGAACALLVVNTAAAAAALSAAITARSRPDFLMPHDTPAARKPAGAATPPATGVTARSATVMRGSAPRPRGRASAAGGAARRSRAAARRRASAGIAPSRAARRRRGAAATPRTGRTGGTGCSRRSRARSSPAPTRAARSRSRGA